MKKGFTLVELIIVIMIIAILSVIGMAFYGNTQRNARDSKRKADIDAISKALEANYNSASTQYPTLAPSMFRSGEIPKDPFKVDYSGVGVSDIGATYTICADLESDGREGADTTTGTTANAIDDYCASNQQ